MVNLATSLDCTGCAACYNICVRNAITMHPNMEGFLFPEIDNAICIECKNCEQVCPVLHSDYNNMEPKCFAAYANDDVRRKSSSGGIFTELAKSCLNNGGVVCGAAFDDDFNVRHIMIESIQELEKIRGTKYVQSNIDLIFRMIKKQLDSNRIVLFSGLPCQVAGLKKYLNKMYQNLYTVDLICHGVPSPKVYRKYLDSFSEKRIIDVNFRNKEIYGWSSSSTISFDDGSRYINSHKNDSFYKAFLPCMSVRNSCSSCKFSNIPRQGDISIGDFWGVEKYHPELTDGKGVSAVLINSATGGKIWNLISDNLEKVIPTTLENISADNPTLKRPFHAHSGRKHFFSVLDVLPFDIAVEHALTHHYDVGIVGLWYGINYGSILTYYALYEVIRSMGYDPIFLAKPNKLWTEKFNHPDTIANKFIRSRCNVSNFREDRDWGQMNDHCDMFILGADVIWNYEICGKNAGQYFFLDFVDSNKKKIAYSSSFGSGYYAPEDARRKSQYYLNRFDYVAVREQEGINICKEKFNVDAVQVIDPVFLLSKEFYEGIAAEAKINETDKYITTYILGADEQKRNLIVELSTRLACSNRNFVDPNRAEEGAQKLALPVISAPSIEKWLYYIANCELFIGDSFHGLCFALIFRKQFVCFVNRNEPSKVRFISLLQICDLEDRLIYTDENYGDKMESILRPIDWDTVYDKLNVHIEKSRLWLKNALDTPKIATYSEKDILDAQTKELMELQYKIQQLEAELDELKRTMNEDIQIKRWLKRKIKDLINNTKV